MIEFAGVIINNFGWIQALSMLIIFLALWTGLRYSLRRLRNSSRLLKITVLLGNIFVFTGLSGFILKPEIHSSQPMKVRLNTSTEALPSVGYPDFEVINSHQLSKQQSNRSVNRILDPEQILFQYPKVEKIEVIGDGLLESQWKAFDNLMIDYSVPELTLGLINVEWSKTLNLGDTLLITGELQLQENTSSKDKKFTLQLVDPADNTVSQVQIEANNRFMISTVPKLSGNHRYLLKLLRNDLTKEQLNQSHKIQQALHTSVTDNSQVRIAVIQSSPSFETKQLQNWAAEKGAQFFVKTTISRNKSIDRSTNFPDLDSNKLSADFFNNFDLIIFDGRRFSQLTKQQNNWLKDAVEKGLGLLILVDHDFIKMKNLPVVLEGIQLELLNQSQQSTLSWLDNNNHWTTPIETPVTWVAARITIDPLKTVNSQNLVIADNGETIVHQQDFGSGRVAVSLLKTTHQWATSGKSIEHSHYWQNLISHISRTGETDRIFLVNNRAVNFSNHLTTVCVQTNAELNSLKVLFKGINDNQQTVLLQKDITIPAHRCGVFWPKQSGWYQLLVDVAQESRNQKLNSWTYIESESDWLAHQQIKRIKATLRKQQAFMSPSENFVDHTQAINRWIFWWLSVIGSTMIWLERKFFG